MPGIDVGLETLIFRSTMGGFLMDEHITKSVTAEVLRVDLERRIGETAHADTSTKPGNPAEEPSVDYPMLDCLGNLQTEADPHLVKVLLEMFLDDTEERLGKLRAAGREEDAEGIRHKSHVLRGRSVYMGATRVARICKEFEHAGDSRNVGEASELLEALEQKFGRVRSALQTVLLNES